MKRIEKVGFVYETRKSNSGEMKTNKVDDINSMMRPKCNEVSEVVNSKENGKVMKNKDIKQGKHFTSLQEFMDAPEDDNRTILGLTDNMKISLAKLYDLHEQEIKLFEAKRKTRKQNGGEK